MAFPFSVLAIIVMQKYTLLREKAYLCAVNLKINTMKRLFMLLSLFLALCATAMAQLHYHEATQFKVIGRPVPDASRVYTRLPDSLKGKVRDALWNLGQNTAGMAVRFCSNARQIGVRWKNHSVFNMNHMTATGVRGLDLYCLQDDGQWVFVNSARPGGRLANKSKIIDNLDGREHEYMLYLPLYEGIDSLEIGVEEGAGIGNPRMALPVESKPVVWYGTSITQGGCASRPGMAATSIVERRLNRVVVNLGFSGNGKLDPEVAEVMAKHDAGLYIMDMLPNCTSDLINEKIERFYTILRKAHPDTPILLVENPIFPPTRFDSEMRKEIEEKNATLAKFYKKFRAAGDKNVFFVSSAGMIGTDNEGTVDGIHFTDLGFERCADYMTPIIKRYLKE